MITLTTFVAIVSGPPVGAVLRNVVLPEQVSALAITTLIGGTVGGYIVYAGAHRLLDSGVSGLDNVQTITQASIIGILITGLMRILLFLAILGVVTMGAQLDPESLAASAFQVAAGEVGLRVFGIVLWAAAITSVIGASYTTVTFITPRTAGGERLRPWLVAGFIVITSVIYLLLGTAPQTLLVFAGAFNGILLPVGIGVILFVGWFRGDLMGGYRYPKWLLVLGTLAWLATLYFAVNAISPAIELFTGA
jgi:Mn2+/Fe2+ NRAMP family transporter